MEQIAQTVVVRFQDREVRIQDLGRVQRAHKEREMITRTDGAESVQIDIYKEADANIVAVAAAVKQAVGSANKQLPASMQPGKSLAARLFQEEGATLAVVADRSQFIESSIREVRNTAILGGLLAVLVLYLFLSDVKTTAIVGASIPISLLITFAPLNLAGVTLNIMS